MTDCILVMRLSVAGWLLRLIDALCERSTEDTVQCISILTKFLLSHILLPQENVKLLGFLRNFRSYQS